jgi:hypothetical protein
MRGMVGIAGLLVTLGAGYFVYHAYLTRSAPAGAAAPPQQQIDVIDIKSNLLSIGQAERVYVTAHGTYGTMEQLQQDGPPSLGASNRGYVFTATVDGARAFTVTATPAGPDKAGWPTLVITDAMQVTQQ